jgi:phospholipid/cholesterol/gamma-HCH transport system ATP-binding protein
MATTSALVEGSAPSAVAERSPLDMPVGSAAHTPSQAVVFDRVSLAFDDLVVFRDLSFEVPEGAMTILLGASGTGKSLLLKLVLGLLRPDAGRIFVHGQRVDDMSERNLLRLRADIGMLFQENALFDSLTVEENVGYRLREESELPEGQIRARVAEVLGFIGLGEFSDRIPSALSGGQRRRVAIARAIAANPSLLLFDDPTTGLDPIIATTVDEEIVKLRDLRHATSIVVTHQIRDAFYVATHRALRANGRIRVVPGEAKAAVQVEFMVLYEGRIHFRGTAEQLRATQDGYLRRFLFRTLPPW